MCKEQRIELRHKELERTVKKIRESERIKKLRKRGIKVAMKKPKY